MIDHSVPNVDGQASKPSPFGRHQMSLNASLRQVSLADRQSLPVWRRAHLFRLLVKFVPDLLAILLVDTHPTLQNAALLDWAARLALADGRLQVQSIAIVLRIGRQEVRDAVG